MGDKTGFGKRFADWRFQADLRHFRPPARCSQVLAWNFLVILLGTDGVWGMDLPSQPPPLPPAPPAPIPFQPGIPHHPGGAPKRGSLLWLWIVLGVLVFVGLAVAVLVGLTAPMVMKQQKKGYLIEATSNARQVHLALLEFETDYGVFPNPETAPDVMKETGSPISVNGASSNAYFRQLLAAGLGNERMFYSKSAGRKPDDITDGGRALEKGECGFAYIAGLSTVNDGSAPLLVTPLIPGTRKFDPKPFGGKAIVVRIDGSVMELPISSNGEVLGTDGMDILDPSHRYWGGARITIAYPE